MILALIVLAIGLSVLIFSSNYLVNAAVNIAKFFNVSTMLIGLTIVAFGTSAPELFLSGMAAIEGNGNISVGNVIGSNIFNLGFILGLAAIVSPLIIRKKMLKRDAIFLFCMTILVFIMTRDQYVGLWEGMLLLALLIGYTTYLWIKKDVPESEIQEVKEELKEAHKLSTQQIHIVQLLGILLVLSVFVAKGDGGSFSFQRGYSPWMVGILVVLVLGGIGGMLYHRFKKQHIKISGLLFSFLILIASLIALIISSEHVINAAVYLAELRGMSEWAIGATIIAMGTSLPELAVSITALLKKDYGLSVGNVIGSDIFNVLGIIGISSVIKPIILQSTCLLESCEGWRTLMMDINFSIFALIITLFITLVCMRTKWRISRTEGMLLF
ncbi:MAG: calcium/sodium antiporter [Candidatus Peribacteria bacterium]|jgi:cation:H+ antiporter|nr:calcium/sodium antiporter [Candidatus Peribacteria bacterium]